MIALAFLSGFALCFAIRFKKVVELHAKAVRIYIRRTRRLLDRVNELQAEKNKLIRNIRLSNLAAKNKIK